jgi:Arc/MetJ-type ribon-helix-helix transcriptional regulator
MTDRDTNQNESDMTNINLRLSEAFLDDIDASWQAEGFNSRSEFMRYALRDAVKHPGLSRETWKSIAATEHELRTGDTKLISREEVIDQMKPAPEEIDD